MNHRFPRREIFIIPSHCAIVKVFSGLFVLYFNSSVKSNYRERSQNTPPYEVDFLFQRENDIFPVEVKAETNTKSRSLKKYKELYPDTVKLRIRFSLDNLKLDDDLLNIPLFMADQCDRLIGLALEKNSS